ncbi:uncharacterized protein LOC133524705 [Cydia pomonella]|uniref:uncharacterized protein LOC133524705 n=1 Tax=Cydia pomonella TaxID=82600 RepID=UPI002ADDDF32|nr:uncharacterized protein LOC133524705 [Cydia pomonella]
MAEYIFKDDYEVLADPHLKLVVWNLIKHGFIKGNILVEPVGQKSAHVKRFIYEEEDGTTFKMIGKFAPVADELRKNTINLFNNEMVMYNLVLLKLNDIQNSEENSEKIRFPACYGILTEAPYEFTLLEDLKEARFEMLDRRSPLTNESVRLVVKNLAKYHSLCYVFKNSEPEIYENYLNKLSNVWAIMFAEAETEQFLESSVNDLLEIMHDESDKYKNVLNRTLTQVASTIKKIESYEKDSKYSVIQQGDCWTKNIMFILQDGKPVDDVMIDYQLARESSPASDLLYLILNSTDHATRLKHYHEWIDYYHENLDYSLNLHGLKAESIFPKDQLDTDLRIYGELMVSLSVMLSTILVRESKDDVDIQEFTREDGVTGDEMTQDTLLDISTIVQLREKIMGIIDTALEFGLI